MHYIFIQKIKRWKNSWHKQKKSSWKKRSRNLNYLMEQSLLIALWIRIRNWGLVAMKDWCWCIVEKNQSGIIRNCQLDSLLLGRKKLLREKKRFIFRKFLTSIYIPWRERAPPSRWLGMLAKIKSFGFMLLEAQKWCMNGLLQLIRFVIINFNWTMSQNN